MPIGFTVTVQKVGSSLQIVLPKPITDGLGIKQGDKISLTVTDHQIVAEKKG